MPFEVSIDNNAAFPVVTLSNVSNHCFAEIFSFGALLNNFSINHRGEYLNVIDGFENTGDAVLTISSAFKSAKLSPFVCRVNNAAYHFGEANYKLTKFSLGKNAIHGLLYNQVFDIVDQISNEEEASVRLAYHYDNEKEGYPFTFSCEVEYKLSGDCSLTITTNIKNLDDNLIPVADGWHPYFTLGSKIDECQLEFQGKEMLEFDSELIPTGKLIPYQQFGSLTTFGDTFFDNCFTLNFAECQPMCVFRNPEKKVEVQIYPTESYPYLQVYTPDHRRSIAIENLSAAPDAFNNGMGLHVLEAGQSKMFQTKFVINPL